MKRSVNFGGKRTWAKGFSANNLLYTMRALGMSDDGNDYGGGPTCGRFGNW